MLNYETLKEKPKEFLAATGLTLAEFELILPVFQIKYADLFEPGLNRKGKPRQRREGGGVKEKLRTDEDKLLFILVYQKTYPLQTMHGLQFGLSQPQTNEWSAVQYFGKMVACFASQTLLQGRFFNCTGFCAALTPALSRQ